MSFTQMQFDPDNILRGDTDGLLEKLDAIQVSIQRENCFQELMIF